MIIEDDDAYASALCASLAAFGHDVVGTYARAEDALESASESDARVAIVDLMLPGIDGVQALRALRKLKPDLKLLVLSAFIDRERFDQCLAAGADGFLFKGTRLKNIAMSVVDVRDGHAPVSPELARYLVDSARKRLESQEDFGLTDREREVLELLARGHAYESIATALGIKLGTVQNHIKSIYRKLEVSSKAEAVMVAVRAGIVQLG